MRERDKCITKPIAEAYDKGWSIGLNTYNVEGEYEEPPAEDWMDSAEGAFLRGLWDGLRIDRQLRAKFIHERRNLSEDERHRHTADVLGDCPPADEGFKETIRLALATADMVIERSEEEVFDGASRCVSELAPRGSRYYAYGN